MVESLRNPAELLQQQWVAHRGEAHIVQRLTAQGNGPTVCGNLAWGRLLSTMKGKGLQETILCYECLAAVAPRLLQLFPPPISVGNVSGDPATTCAETTEETTTSLFEQQ